MAFERFFAVTRPTSNFSCFHSWIPILVIGAAVGTIVAIPSLITILHPTPNVRYGCGRKAAFGTTFGIIDYFTNILGYSTAFSLNAFVLVKAHQLTLSHRQYQKIRAYTVIAFISTVLISIPNLCSLINALIFKLPDLLITPTAIMACLNCSMQFFVYIYFSKEYRNRAIFLFSFGKIKKESSIFAAKNTPIAFVTVNKNEVTHAKDYF